MKRWGLGIGIAFLCIGLGVVGVKVQTAWNHHQQDHENYHRLLEWAQKVSKAAEKEAAK